jgi:hypothetical protein
MIEGRIEMALATASGDEDATPSVSLEKSSPRAAGGPKKAGGPITQRGRETSSKNAIKHAINSSSPVAGGEHQDDWEEHLECFRQDWQPMGAYEEELLQDLASLYWRLRRVPRAEVAYIDARYATIDDPDPRSELKVHRSREDLFVEDAGCDLEDALAFLTLLFGMDEGEEVDFERAANVHLIILWLLRTHGLSEMDTGPFELDPITSGAFKAYVWDCSKSLNVSYMEFWRTIKDFATDVLVERQGRERSTRMRRTYRELDAVLPSPDELSTLTKYEAHLRRSILKTVSQLEIAQRQRSGDRPSPLQRIEVTVDHAEGA